MSNAEEFVRSGSRIELNTASGDSRRTFFRKIGGAAVVGAATGVVGIGSFTELAEAGETHGGGGRRAQEAFQIRERVAAEEREIATPTQVTNGDEKLYGNFIGNYSKGLPHNGIGEVDKAAYQQLVEAAEDGRAEAFENVPLGGTVKLANPMAGVAFDMEGTDSHQLAIGPPPALASQVRAKCARTTWWSCIGWRYAAM
jgi:hypothetical protein